MKDGTYLSELIRQKKASPKELIQEMSEKAKQHEDLNMFVELDEDKALDYVAHQLPQSQNGPFYGVPFPLKDLGQSCEGMRQTNGSRLYQSNISQTTNCYMKKITSAGFVPFGVTRAPEFGFKNITDPSIYGTTKNAWSKTHHAGGSSGGAASVVASGIAPIAGASDGGGSIRIPASFSGLIGLKPSRGNIVTGPTSWRDWQGASVNFMLGVSMRDTEKMLQILSPDNQISPFLQPVARLRPQKGTPLKIAVCLDSPVGNPVSEEAKEAVKQACLFLEQQGHEVHLIQYPVDGNQLIRSYYQMNGGETAHMMDEISLDLKRSLTKNDMEAMTWTLYQYGTRLSAADYVASFGAWDDATSLMETLFNIYDVFMSPTTTMPAPHLSTDLQSDRIRLSMEHAEELSKRELEELVYDMFEKGLWLTPYTQLANLTGQPAISLPTYVTKEGLPMGVQLMAAKGQDALLIEIGELFERYNQFKLPSVYR